MFAKNKLTEELNAMCLKNEKNNLNETYEACSETIETHAF